MPGRTQAHHCLLSENSLRSLFSRQVPLHSHKKDLQERRRQKSAVFNKPFVSLTTPSCCCWADTWLQACTQAALSACCGMRRPPVRAPACRQPSVPAVHCAGLLSAHLHAGSPQRLPCTAQACCPHTCCKGRSWARRTCTRASRMRRASSATRPRRRAHPQSTHRLSCRDRCRCRLVRFSIQQKHACSPLGWCAWVGRGRDEKHGNMRFLPRRCSAAGRVCRYLQIIASAGADQADPEAYVAAAQSLVRWLRSNSEGLPLVVNTPGWIKVAPLTVDSHGAQRNVPFQGLGALKL